MAFSYTRNIADCSSLKYVSGTYNAASVTSGTIDTGLELVYHADASSATSTPSTQIVISGGSLALTVTSGQTGTWFAVGV